MSFLIRKFKVEGNISLAPMSGFSDSPFRRICKEHGSALSTTAFIQADTLLLDAKKEKYNTRFFAEERPLAMQIYGSNPESILKAALLCQDMGADIIDLNLGCSTRKVSARGSGAGLLQKPEKIKTIVRSFASSLTIPFTAKIRLGWDEQNLNYLEVSHIIQEEGAAAITVHGRTRNQKYTGHADWNKIAEIKSSLSIPVIGNGDINSNKQALSRMQESRVDAVLIGRSARGNPWIFQANQNNSLSQLKMVMLRHLKYMSDFYPDDQVAILFRKHAVFYINNYLQNNFPSLSNDVSSKVRIDCIDKEVRKDRKKESATSKSKNKNPEKKQRLSGIEVKNCSQAELNILQIKNKLLRSKITRDSQILIRNL